MEPLLDFVKVFSWELGHMIKMIAMPIYGKTFENLILRNRMADDLKTWYVLLGTQALPSLFKW